MGNRMTKTVLFAASALLSMGAFGAGAARFGTLRNSDWVVTNAWQAVSNKTHDLILEMGQEGSLPPNWQTVSNFAMNAIQSLQPAYDYTDNALISFSSTGIVFRSLSYGTPNRWTDATGCVWEVQTTRVCTNANEEWAYTMDGQTYTREQMIEAAGGDEGYSRILDWEDLTFINKDGVSEEFEGWYVFDGSGTAPVGYNYSTGLIPSYASDPYLTQVTYYGNITATRGELVTVTNLVGRVALTNDISQAISTNNSAFVSAVLAAPLVGADPNDLSELAEYGSYGTVGAAILALIAGLAALKRRVTSAETALAQKASFADLPYALVEPGKWEFSGLQEDATGADMAYDNGYWTLYVYYDGESDSFTAQGSENDLVVVFQDTSITAARPSLPGHLLDRANNLIDATTGNVTLTLPPFVAGKVRDLLVACTIGLDTNDEPWSVIFQGGDGEEISFKSEGDDAASATFPVPDAAGDWWYSLTERAPHVFAVSLKQLQDVSQPTQTQGGE